MPFSVCRLCSLAWLHIWLWVSKWLVRRSLACRIVDAHRVATISLDFSDNMISQITWGDACSQKGTWSLRFLTAKRSDFHLFVLVVGFCVREQNGIDTSGVKTRFKAVFTLSVAVVYESCLLQLVLKVWWAHLGGCSFMNCYTAYDCRNTRRKEYSAIVR